MEGKNRQKWGSEFSECPCCSTVACRIEEKRAACERESYSHRVKYPGTPESVVTGSALPDGVMDALCAYHSCLPSSLRMNYTNTKPIFLEASLSYFLAPPHTVCFKF